MRPSLLSLAVLALAPACGGTVDPATLHAEKPFLTVSISTRPAATGASALPDSHPDVELSSTFAFDNLCEILSTGLHVESRADAAPALVLSAAKWAASGPSRFAASCKADGSPCDSDLVRLRWDDQGGRFDASPATPDSGLPQPTTCAAAVVADALSADQEVVEGTCENLLGTFAKAGEKPVFGPVHLEFRALCRRP